MEIFVFILIVAFVAWYSYSLWHDGYTSGVMEERRKRIRSIAMYNTHVSTFRTDISLLQEELDDIKKRMPACTKPNAFEENVISAKILNEDFEPKMTVEED